MKASSYIKNTAILFVAMAITKIAGAVFKIPLANILGGTGMGYFSTAYALYSPILAITASGVPTVMMRLTAQYMAQNRTADAAAVKHTALKLFTLIGAAGMFLVMIFARPFAVYFAASPESTAALLAISPAVMLCCIACVLRGYYEGLNEVTPSSAAAITEAVSRAVAGLAASYGVVYYARMRFESGSDVFGIRVSSYEAAHNASLPYAAAAAIAAVSLSELVGLVTLIIIDKRRKHEHIPPPKNYSGARTAKMLLTEILPISAGSLVMNCVSFVDLLTVTNSISRSVETYSEYYNRAYPLAIDAAGGIDKLANFIYGSYTGISMSLFMLIPSFACMAERTTAPEIAAACSLGDKECICRHIRTQLQTAAMIGFPACFGAAALAEPVLSLLYPSRSAEVSVCVIPFTILCCCGFFMIFSSSLFGVFQAINKAHIPLILMTVSIAIKLILNIILISIPQLNIAGAAVSSSISYLITAICAYFILQKCVGCKVRLASAVVPSFCCALLCAITAIIVCRLTENRLPSLACVALSVISGGFVYILSLISTLFFVKTTNKSIKTKIFTKTLAKSEKIG